MRSPDAGYRQMNPKPSAKLRQNRKEPGPAFEGSIRLFTFSQNRSDAGSLVALRQLTSQHRQAEGHGGNNGRRQHVIAIKRQSGSIGQAESAEAARINLWLREPCGEV